MNECICSSCKNLKSVNVNGNMETNGVNDEYNCEFGFPAEECLDCEVEGCELTCDHYISDQEEIDYFITNCTTCGIELKLQTIIEVVTFTVLPVI